MVEGGGLQTFLCDPMHTLRSSGYTLSGIYIDDLRTSPRRCAHPRKKVVLAAFLIVIQQTTYSTLVDHGPRALLLQIAS